MPGYVALLRGINVGRAKRVAMADLRGVFEDLGYTDVRTLLNSGNVVFESKGRLTSKDADRAQERLLGETGVSSKITLLSEAEMRTVLDDCPLLKMAKDYKRLLVAVPTSRAQMKRFQELSKKDWKPETLALGSRAAYIWSPEGIIESKLFKVVGSTLGDDVTTRNWATLTKIAAAAGI